MSPMSQAEEAVRRTTLMEDASSVVAVVTSARRVRKLIALKAPKDILEAERDVLFMRIAAMLAELGCDGSLQKITVQ